VREGEVDTVIIILQLHIEYQTIIIKSPFFLYRILGNLVCSSKITSLIVALACLVSEVLFHLFFLVRVLVCSHHIVLFAGDICPHKLKIGGADRLPLLLALECGLI